MPPNIANGSHGHWASRHKAKLAYWAELDLMQGPKSWTRRDPKKGDVTYQIPAPPKRPWPKATIQSVMVLGAAMDDSNAMRRHKWVEDWLVTRGYIADDRKKCLTWGGFPEQVITRKEVARIVLTLESAA